MIVPFVFCLDQDNYTNYLWVFYKFLDFCIKNKFPIIAQSDYFNKLELLREKNSYAFDTAPDYYNYSVPTIEQLYDNNTYAINSEEQNKIINGYSSSDDAWYNVLKHRDKNLEKILQDKIKLIQKDTKKKIDAFLTWCWYPSLEYVAKKNNIKVIMLELSTIRRGIYDRNLCYFNFHDKFNSNEVIKRYRKYKKNNSNKFVFKRKELCALFLKKESMYLLEEMMRPPIYEYGYATNAKNDVFCKIYSKFNDKYVLDKISGIVNKDYVLVRNHPSISESDKNKEYDNDESLSSFEFVTKCSRIICNISNIGFETLLAGRTLVSVCDKSPFCFDKTWDFDHVDEYLVDDMLLNYLVFGYFVPLEFAFDKDYIMWRLQDPTEEMIYDKNLEYILKQRGLDLKKMQKKSYHQRLSEIFKSKNIEENEYNKYINSSLCLNVKQYLKKIDIQSQKINEQNNIIIQNLKLYEQQINNILNSQSWKLTEPLRKISSIIRKRK